MSLRLGDKVIAGIGTHTKYNAHTLLDFKWTDHILNEMSWLRADTFSWQSGDVYTSVYNLLLTEYQNGTAFTDAIETTVNGRRGPNGLKITTNESEVITRYDTTGIAWYYIIDIENRRFKLPRTKYGFIGVRGNVGGYTQESLPNIRGTWHNTTENQYWEEPTGAVSRIKLGGDGVGGSAGWFDRMVLDASRSSSAYQDNAPVQQRATQMYLYFYVGEFSQTATEQAAGITTEVLNNKADKDLSNISVSASAKQSFDNWGMPNYSSSVQQTLGTQYTASSNGYIFGRFSMDSNTSNRSVLEIGGKTFTGTTGGMSAGFACTYIFPVAKNQTYKMSGASGTIFFVPCIGG